MRVRATPLPPDERRRAIIAALIPLLVEQGGDVTTREVAKAAGVAEGTIFRVFPDKQALLMAAAEEAINPADGQADFDAAMAAAPDLRAKVVVAAARVLERMQLTMAVMVAVRSHLMAAFHEQHRSDAEPKFGPPEFVRAAHEDLHRRLTGLFEPHRDELAVEPEVAATALRSLLFGASRPDLGMPAVLDAEQIADLVLNGVGRRND